MFDLPGQHAFNVTVLACALAYAALAPALLVPGAAFFAVRYLVHKHNLLCLHLDNVAGAGDGLFGSHDAAVIKDVAGGAVVAAAHGHGGRTRGARKASDGRLLATVVKIIRVSAFVHAAVMAAFMNLRGTPARVACADIILCVLVLRPHAETVFGGGGGEGGGVLPGWPPRPQPPRRSRRRAATTAAAAGRSSAPASTPRRRPRSASARPGRPARTTGGASMASSIGGGGWTLDASPEILLEAERYAGPWGGVEEGPSGRAPDARVPRRVLFARDGDDGAELLVRDARRARGRRQRPCTGDEPRRGAGSGSGRGGGRGRRWMGRGAVDEDGGAAASRPLLTRVVGDYESESDEE